MISLENLWLSWKEFRRGKRKKLDVQEFEQHLEDNLFRLHEELKSKTYRHSHYTSFYITDPKLRHIHKACVRDRIVHHAVYRILYLIFDQSFIFDSYSCRVGRGTHRAVRRLKRFSQKINDNNRRQSFALKCDVKKFFDSVDHQILFERIKTKVKDEKALNLIWEIISSFSSRERERERERGLPIGNLTSQLFANIYLDGLDVFVKRNLKVNFYLRYCDDFILLGKDSDDLLEIMSQIEKFLKFSLKLMLHPGKVSLCKLRQGIDFCGYVTLPYHIELRTTTRRRMFKKINNENLSSYLGLIQHCNSYKLKKKIIGIHKILRKY